MARRQLFVRTGETVADAQRREDIEAPYGRCGDQLKPDEYYQGCGEPLDRRQAENWLVCRDFPDCCRP